MLRSALLSLSLLLLAVPARADIAPPPSAFPSDADADTIARTVVEKCGDIYSIEELAFTFTATADGAVKGRRSHVWRPRDGQVTVTAEERSITLQIVEGKPVLPPGEGAAAAAMTAWAQFTNDAYWLLAPCKLLDPGVQRSLTPEGELQLSFQNVGLTPGDVYRLQINPYSARVDRWSYTLESGRTGAVRWAGYQTFGPLMLSTQRDGDDGSDFHIRFTDVRVTP